MVEVMSITSYVPLSKYTMVKLMLLNTCCCFCKFSDSSNYNYCRESKGIHCRENLITLERVYKKEKVKLNEIRTPLLCNAYFTRYTMY